MRGLGAIFRPPGTGGQLLSLGKRKGRKIFVPPVQSAGGELFRQRLARRAWGFSATLPICVTAPNVRGGEFGPMGLRWRVQGESLAMVRPIPQPGWRNRRNRGGCPPDCSPAGFMIVELNRDVFLKRFLPELAQRYFGGPDGLLYNVAIVDAANPPQFIYASEAHPSPDLVSSPDETVHLFSSRRGRGFESRQGNPARAGQHRQDAKGFLRLLSPSRGPGATRRRAGGASSARRSSRTLPPQDGDWWSGIRAVPWRKRWP